MPASNADIGYNSSFGIEGETAGVYVEVAEVVNITPFGFSRDEEEVTHLKSPDRFKEFIAALKEATPVELGFNWIPSENDPLVAAFEATKGSYEIKAPNGVRLRFSGFFTAYTPGELTNGKMSGSATIRPTGKPEILGAE